MCCLNQPKQVKELLASGKKKIIAYKLYWVYRNIESGKKRLETLYFRGQYYNHGEIKSDSKRTKPCLENIVIDKGLHVYLNKKSAEYFLNNCYSQNHYGLVVAPVICDMKDLIAIEGRTAVFKKITISKNAWKNAKRRKE